MMQTKPTVLLLLVATAVLAIPLHQLEPRSDVNLKQDGLLERDIKSQGVMFRRDGDFADKQTLEITNPVFAAKNFFKKTTERVKHATEVATSSVGNAVHGAESGVKNAAGSVASGVTDTWEKGADGVKNAGHKLDQVGDRVKLGAQVATGNKQVQPLPRRELEDSDDIFQREYSFDLSD